MMDRRSFLRLAGGTAVLSLTTMQLGSRAVGAQEKTGLAGLGVPQLRVTLTDKGYQVSAMTSVGELQSPDREMAGTAWYQESATTPAGWTLVTFENRQHEGDNSADLMPIPPGLTAESFIKSLAAPGDDAPQDGPPPAEIYQATFAGAPWTPAGTAAQGLVLLTAGEWLAFNGGTPSLGPAAFTVTETDGQPAKPPALNTDVEVTFQEFAFLGLDKPDALGQKIWKITNSGKQPHLMTINQVPPGTTREQLMASMTAMMTGQPDPDAIPPERMRNVGGCATISHGQTAYLSLDLKPGTYGAMCFFPDQQSGAPHAMLGMTQVFTLG